MSRVYTERGGPALDVIDAGAQEAGRAIARLLHGATGEGSIVHPGQVMTTAELAALHGPRAVVVAFTVSGGLVGAFALVTSESTARVLADELLMLPRTDAEGLTNKHLGALTELGNIGASAYLNGVAARLGRTCLPSVPELVLDDATRAIEGGLGVSASVQVARMSIGVHALDLALAVER